DDSVCATTARENCRAIWFTITGHGLSTGTAVRFYGVQDGALLPLVDGGLYYVIRTSANSFKLAGSIADANNGFAIPLSLAASITSGSLASFSPQVELGSSNVSLSARSIAISGNIQTQSFTATATAGDLGLLEEAWISTGSTSLSTPAAYGLLIDRTRTDLRRAILSTSSLSLPSSGSLTLKGFLDLLPTSAGTNTNLSFPGSVTITGELTSSANLTLNVSGALNVSRAGSIESSGDLTLNAGSFNLDADATRPGWELTTVPSSVTAVTSNQSVAVGSSLAAQNLAFTGDVKLVIDIVADVLSYVGVDGSSLPHGLLTGDVLYYKNGASNGALGRAGLLNTNTSDPSLATAYTVQLLDGARFQLKRNNVIVDLSSASGSNDALVGLDIVDTQVETSTTQLTQIGTQQVQVGNQWTTYDLSLNQDAFYRPATGEIREYFVPGVDFTVASIPWSSYGTSAPASSSSQALSWDQYSTSQRSAVLDYLGYKPLYAANFNNIKLNQNRNGVLTSTAIDNPWASGTNKIWLPSSGNLAGMAIEGTTDAFAKVVSNETFEGASSTASKGWSFAAGTAPTFASGGTPASPSTGTNTSINYFSQFLGTFANGVKTQGQDAWKTYNLDGNGGTVSFDLYRIDSWDNEKFRVYANDLIALESSFGMANVSAPISGANNNYTWTITPKNDYGDHYGITGWFDQTFRVNINVPTGVSSLKLGFGSTLDESANNESYGIDALSVVNASSIYSTTSAATSATQALKLDGVNDYADLPDFSLGGDLTVEAWVYMNQAQTWSRIVDIGNAAANNNILLASYADTGRLVFETYGNGISNGVTITDSPLPINRWVHVAAVLNNDKSTNIYLDGVLVKTGSSAALPTDMVRSNTWVGRSNWNGDAYFNGAIRDLKIWNDARTSAEVRSDMSLSPSGSDNALAAWYPFSGPSGAQLLQGATTGDVYGLGSADANGASREWVGTATDTAKVLYTQNRSALTASTLSQTISNPLDSAAGSTTFTAVVSDLEPLSGSNTGGSEWRVSYDSNGNRTYRINGLLSNFSSSPQTSNATISRLPDWYDNSTYSSVAYPGTGPTTAFGTQKGNAPFILGYSQRPNLETFDSSASGWAGPSGAVPITNNGYFGSFMGRFSNGSKSNGQDVWKTYNLEGNGGQISFTLYKLDSWDNEFFRVYANDQVIFEQQLVFNVNYGAPFTTNLNGYSATSVPHNDYAPHYGNEYCNDQSFDISISIPVGITFLKLGFSSTLDQSVDDESYGIDNLTVSNANQNPGLFAPSSNSQNLDYIRSTASLVNRSLVNSTGTLRTVGSIPSITNGYLASSGSSSNTDAVTKSEALRVVTTDASGSSQAFAGYTRLARLTTAAEVSAATAKAAGRGGQIAFAVDGYQPTNSSVWTYYNGQPMGDVWGNRQLYFATPSTNWDTANAYAVGMDGNLAKIDNASENATIDSQFGLAWIGAYRPSSGAGFQWTDGSGLSYSNWAPGEPNNSFGQVTTTFSNNFDVNTSGFASTRRDTRYGTFHGRWGDQGAWETYIYLGIDPNQTTQITYDFLRFDSWDNENMRFYVQTNLGSWDLRKSFQFDRQEGAFDLLNQNGFRMSFNPTRFGNFAFSGWNDQTFSVTLYLPLGVTYCNLYWDAELNQNNDDESWGMDNFVVRQSPGERYVNIYDGGQWNDLSNDGSLPGVVELTVPNINWQPGEPNDGGAANTSRNDENYLY
ncbi:MAG: hypothetical protein EBS53_06495, partial [Bacteroidetes bacterium]|nr:hypothetical protein [Bacteroidota bacterium]